MYLLILSLGHISTEISRYRNEWEKRYTSSCLCSIHNQNSFKTEPSNKEKRSKERKVGKQKGKVRKTVEKERRKNEGPFRQ